MADKNDLSFLPSRPGERQPFLIAGPCVIESESLVMEAAETLRAICERLEMGFVFKSSFDKANRSSHLSYRGPGLEAGLRILEKVRSEVGVPVLTDVHDDTPIDEVASVVDVLQTPAFLVRQTNFIQRVAKAGLPVNVKKGQFQAPWDMGHVVEKMRAAGAKQVFLCERGVTHGYNRLVVDMTALQVMRETGCPVVMDATHGVQQPGGLGATSGGTRAFVPLLARAAMAVGVDGLFMETHPDPENALSDGPNMWPLSKMEELLASLLEISKVARASAYGEVS